MKNFEALLEASKSWKPTPEYIEAFHLRMKEREEEFAKQSKLKTPTSEWYERSYDI